MAWKPGQNIENFVVHSFGSHGQCESTVEIQDRYLSSRWEDRICTQHESQCSFVQIASTQQFPSIVKPCDVAQSSAWRLNFLR
mmetsp:Transcript_22880/g.62070  ORF Transcript_22880/g.62070 Transcript_22880/m.62070 type:complete len:83 (-) Transcript_22880:658-906(-)